jgi:AcrR family transcriptional regulator
MTPAKHVSKYESPLREEQKEATRKRILDAAGRLMENCGLEEFSFAAIAKEANVQERTVYRHFNNKDALLKGLWVWFQARIRYGGIPCTESDLLAQPLRTFPAMDENEQLTRAMWASPQGREFRLSNVEERKAGIKAAVRDATRSLPDRQARWIAAVVHLLNSGAAWETMKDYWGFTGEQAAKASAMAIELLLNAVRTNVPPIVNFKKEG